MKEWWNELLESEVIFDLLREWNVLVIAVYFLLLKGTSRMRMNENKKYCGGLDLLFDRMHIHLQWMKWD